LKYFKWFDGIEDIKNAKLALVKSNYLYPDELEMKDTTESDKSASYID
jgi:hypothetical protein